MATPTPPSVAVGGLIPTAPAEERGHRLSTNVSTANYVAAQMLVQSGLSPYKTLEHLLADALGWWLQEYEARKLGDAWLQMALQRSRQEREDQRLQHFDQDVGKLGCDLMKGLAMYWKTADGPAMGELIERRWTEAESLPLGYWRERQMSLFKDIDSIKKSVVRVHALGLPVPATLVSYLGL